MARARTLLPTTALAVTAALALVACGGDPAPGLSVTVPPQTSTASATKTPAPTQTPRPTQTVSPDAAQAIEDLNEFVDEYGYPPDANFAQLRIPKLGVDAQVGSRYVGADGLMADPEGPAAVVWYDMSAWPGMGGTPGGGGNAIFSGHVDYDWTVAYAGGVHYRGSGVFRELGMLVDGDIIEVDYNGTTYRYAVSSVQQLDADAANWGSVWSVGGGDSITLYTCGGDFDPSTLTYSDRVVVRAQRIS